MKSALEFGIESIKNNGKEKSYCPFKEFQELWLSDTDGLSLSERKINTA